MQAMKNSESFPATFIGEQVDILAKLARLEGLETLAFILELAKAETLLAKDDAPQRKRHDEHRAS
jgi:hypothetical protein